MPKNSSDMRIILISIGYLDFPPALPPGPPVGISTNKRAYVSLGLRRGILMSFKVLVVDNVLEDLEVTKMILSGDSDFEVTTDADSNAAIELVKKNPHALSAILLDFRMPKDGLITAQEMYAINPALQIAILSADQTRDALKKSIAIGIRNFIDKDEDNEILLGVVR